MDEQWTRKAAREAALKMVRDADGLLEQATSIFAANDYSVDHLNVNEARECLREVCYQPVEAHEACDPRNH